MSALLDSFLWLFEWSTVKPILVSNLKLIFSLWKIQPNLLLLILVKVGIMYLKPQQIIFPEINADKSVGGLDFSVCEKH